ncbi:hypothetical protein ASPWEDRAFT_166988 [Aspergillus wentii DTO 134E9]|uniref:Condensation domain-containing protein n=1 Tax=Aspergillus wentii DTO 134E9 TaxID=1073089 RepID=A0A1L9S1E1_ASPWE|nr:uncharacterized protein ASPWEDRAFT_166988 [Aspergillus wentii DTO 134E9]KAI9931061.1 hypothetical protein MW887_010718 [Aspergillus wentii]OJJ40943.1 hypothetical protein ASPWEDRAFT_166988 [Aspergillus wentii DTO 134E9]
MFEAHHAIVDIESKATIEADLRTLYRGDRPLSEPPLYRDYIATALQGSQAADKRFWVDYLQDATDPVFLPDCARANSPGESLNVDVVLVPLEKIKQFSRLQGFTSSTLFKAVFAVTFQI